MAVNWTAKISAFSHNPSRFISSKSAETFLAELLRELRDDRVTDSTKVCLLSPLCEQPALLCPTVSVGEETVLELLSVFAHCPDTCVQFRSCLLVTLTSVLICTFCASNTINVCVDVLDLLLQIVQDTSDLHSDSFLLFRATACESLQELETCCPNLLSKRLELIGGLWAKETSRLHQPYARLHTLVLKNCVYQLASDPGSGDEHLKILVGENTMVNWEADQELVQPDEDSAILSSLIMGQMGTVPILHTGRDCKDLRSVMSAILENSFLLTPLCQAEVLHKLMEMVAMVPVVPPSIFRVQLLRMLGTSEVCLVHTTLLMKYAYTDSLFSTDDEAFILRRLVVLSQHPLLSIAEKLFFMDYVLHFPENRPIGCGNGNETPPVLLTPQLACTLAPTVFDDSTTMLGRFNLLLLIYQEEGEKDGEEGKGMVYLCEHLSLLLHIVVRGHSREIVVMFFRAVFLFLVYFCHVERYSNSIADKLCMLYHRQTHLALHILNLADQTSDLFPECNWATRLCRALQGIITEAPLGQLNATDLSWHLKVLTRVAEEGQIPQLSTLRLLSNVVITPSLCVSSDWRLGNCVLGLCRRLMTHPSLDSLFTTLANILQHIVCCYGDADIQDHAQLYYCLLTTLSKEKLTGIVTQGLREEGHNVKHSLSCIMADTERLTSVLTIHQTDKPVLRLVELKYPEPQGRNKSSLESYPSPSEAQDCPGLEAYRAQFQDSCFGSQITLRYQLNHTMCNLLSCFDRVFSIHLHFSLRDNNYEELSDFNVPFLFRERPSPVVKLRLKPRLPIPTTLSGSAIFSTLNGLSWHTTLPDIHVCFRQAFLPLTVPPTWGTVVKLGIFEGLWDEINVEEQTDYVTTLFCCQLKAGELGSVVEKHLLHPFIISESANRVEFKVIFFIPPQFHILMKVISEEDAVQFNIATDNWRLLPHISSFLGNLLTSLPETVPSNP
ncbi:AP-5 complex subunit beta-1 isoform X1 [Phyllopteryx taeniolatus]|uniref:AP-5 complex subunit beta-1 isoform X1 n=1 Tax=Phyllopteryx taeniolatus TaxID=161469 RepID=UPI002AD47105|nr:AP-5 complex subunit beta-1 isoform X1 [Phyllopteryx taeniolatus]